MCKYFNSNKLQVMLQNPKRVDGRYSDAPQHGHAYCFAMGLPFIPVFFQSAQYLDDEGRSELKQLISTYRDNRRKMFECYTFPIGDMPSNGSWSGFQMADESQREGFILLFREMHNAEAERSVRLKFLAGRRVRISDLRNGQSSEQQADAEGNMTFTINDPADFLFLRYKVVE